MQERPRIFADKTRSEEGWLANVIIQFLQYQKERGYRKEITGSTVRNRIMVLKLFCEMNDYLVPWKKLTRGLFTLLWAIIGLLKSRKLKYSTDDPHRFSFYDDTFRINNSFLGYYHFDYV